MMKYHATSVLPRSSYSRRTSTSICFVPLSRSGRSLFPSLTMGSCMRLAEIEKQKTINLFFLNFDFGFYVVLLAFFFFNRMLRLLSMEVIKLQHEFSLFLCPVYDNFLWSRYSNNYCSMLATLCTLIGCSFQGMPVLWSRIKVPKT